MTPQEKLEILQTVARASHYSYDGKITRKQVGLIFQRFAPLLTAKGLNFDDRGTRGIVLSKLVNRPVEGVSSLSYGEAKALLDEEDIGEILGVICGNN
jgi:hypothetical protein